MNNIFVRYLKILLMVALVIWSIYGLFSAQEILYGGCQGPARLDLVISLIYILVTIILLIGVFIFRKQKAALYILLIESIIWVTHFWVFRGWPLMEPSWEGTTAYFYYYVTAVYDSIGFLIRILLICSFCRFKRISNYFVVFLSLTIFSACLIYIKENPSEISLMISKKIVKFFTEIFGLKY